ncbi:DUF742 domain-containing protein [Microbispora sp. NBRC 16548]|uniref:DUF742 domain-containing protein n=1 Tax=Microbispora sp. NBRC 16548 TaxID=3030994 RepID=UPI0024A55832|nr:DUF742 domain-containing protein [Microbispora sp. NBRC 16548]GLX06643.1 hypothetical protein Misp03_35700 [Microbispora sp. NBRC 16548]
MRRIPRDNTGLVRPYVVTHGRVHPSRHVLDLATLVVSVPDPPPADLAREQRRVLMLCRGGALSIAEISAYLSLPPSVTRVVVADLIDTGHIITRTPAAQAHAPSLELLQEVLDGLRALA